MKNFQAQLEWRPLATLKPYARNNKKHTDSSVQKLVGSIRKFGWDVPIVIDGDGVIIKGHRRHRAAQILKLKQVPCIVRTDLSPAEVKAERIADNRLAEDSFYDYEAISLELEDLAEFDSDFDLKWTGFEPEEIDQLLEGEGAEVEPRERPPSNRTSAAPPPEEEEEGGDGDTSESKSPPEKYPLTIVLTRQQKQAWDALKASLGVKKDTDAVLKLMELI